MVADLSCLHIVKRMEVNLSRAAQQALSSYSFMREKALLQICDTIAEAAGQTKPVGLLQRILERSHLQIVDATLQALKRFSDISVQAGQSEAAEETLADSLIPNEREAALRVLQGLTLLHSPSRSAAINTGAVRQLLLSFPDFPLTATTAGLDTLLALLVNSEAAQVQFLEASGVQQICKVMCNPSSPPELSDACCEFLLLLLNEALPRPTPKAYLRQLEGSIGRPATARIAESKVALAKAGGAAAAGRPHSLAFEDLKPLLRKGGIGGFLTDASGAVAAHIACLSAGERA
eukprot:CAMPEP_0117667998 /NCGR_PEP_ID=MMETSP0804-20121206/11287_1 /TAXON_ID=1074897 /ORGANISM="Tetraselmis astigmatica, Strain CCMP880" /LENGTH=290 /DNA_ID=CAMNT_0005475805 /DNA_START=436 /DNA_END=1308 /DNA_ORIENTATION=-